MLLLRRFELRCEVLIKDLSLLVSLCIAWLMVRRALRRQRRERAARLRSVRLVEFQLSKH